MKWSIALIFCVWMLTGAIQTTTGGNLNLISARDPFYKSLYAGVGYCNIEVNIYSPTNTTYSDNNVLLNVSITGADTCRYRIIQDGTTYGWNTIDCNHDDTVTLSQGYQVMEVQGVNSLCSSSVSRAYTVWEFRPSLVGDINWFLFLGVAFALIILYLDEEDAGKYIEDAGE